MFIRRTSENDLAQIDSLLASSYPVLLAPNYDSAVLNATLPAMIKARPELVTSGTYFAAILDDKIISAGGWTRENPTGGSVPKLGHVRHVVSDPAIVRKGAARAVIETVFQDARDSGMERMECFSTLTAVPFYQAMGFGVVKEVLVPIGPDKLEFQSVLMTREL